MNGKMDGAKHITILEENLLEVHLIGTQQHLTYNHNYNGVAERQGKTQVLQWPS